MTDETNRIEVTEADFNAAKAWFSRKINFETIPEVELINAFARHRIAAIKERDAQIVAWLREDADTLEREDTAWQAAYLAEAIRECADAIERGEVGAKDD